MTLTQFFSLFQQTDFKKYSVLAFKTDLFAASFFSNVHSLLKSHTSCVSLDVEQNKLMDIKAQLETSFLGNGQLYWVKNAHEFDTATKKAWLSYVSTYEGPHTIFYVTDGAAPQESERILLVEVPEYIDGALYAMLYGHFYPGIAFDASFITKILSLTKKLSLDKACMLMGYQTLIGRKHDAFFAYWLSKMIAPEKSLFTLSQHLFARQPKLFAQQWKSLKDDFPDEFWVAYWSEQVWQATLFVSRARSEGIEAAKKITSRLPFSFINKDWQKYTQEDLTHAHQALAVLDYRLKNSAGNCGLELWYQKLLYA